MKIDKVAARDIQVFWTLLWGFIIALGGQTACWGIPTNWQTIRFSSAPTWNGKMLSFSGEQGHLAITPLSDDIVRIRFTNAKSFQRDHSYAVINKDLGQNSSQAEIGPSAAILTTPSLKVKVQYDPLLIEFQNANGESLDADDPTQGLSSRGNGAFRVAKRLRHDEQVYGFGSKNGRLNKRGWQLGGYNYVMWNSDTFEFDPSTDPIYMSIPFYMVLRRGKAHGIFLDNTWRTIFDIGHEQQDLLTFGAEGGELNYYFINGPSPKQVLERYTAITGRMPLPPRWSLGFHQCRYSYFPESRVRWLANTFRKKKVPADAIWLDIHYQDGYKPFTWDKERFPDPKKLISDLASQGFHTVVIVDPHPKVEKGYAPYDSGIEGNHFIKDANGKVFEAPVWPSKADKNPGLSVFPDFSRPATRSWWGSLYQSFVDIGVAGIWNDMNEPSAFVPPTGTLPLDVIHDNEGLSTSHREIHNVYGQLMSRSTFEGLAKLRPNDRPFVLTRASYAGGQRYAAAWPGDNTADWTALRQSLSTLLSMGVSGFPFVGSDIGGFVHAPSAELFTRWLQVGAFSPFMRVHSNFGTPDREPWAFGDQYETINRRAIELRYELLPYVYNVMQQSSETGLPAMRPLFLEFPNDEKVVSIDDQFMFGSDLLVAPILREGLKERAVYLPAGDWFDYWTGEYYSGGAATNIPVTIHSIPIFVRAGAFIFQQPIVQHTGQMSGNPLEVLIAPASRSESSLYEDDGTSLAYRAGEYMSRHFKQTHDENEMTLEVSAPKGSYRPSARSLVLETWSSSAPISVSAQLNGAEVILPRKEMNALKESSSGWSFSSGKLIIKTDDTFQTMQFIVKGHTIPDRKHERVNS